MRFATLFLPLVLVPCCMHGETTGEGTVRSIGLSISALEDASRTHTTKAAAATDVPTILTLERDHESVVKRQLAILDEAVRSLGSCVDHIGRAPPTSPFWSEMNAMGSEVELHSASKPLDLAGAREEEARHETVMTRVVAELRTSQARLDGGSSAYRCREECAHCMD